MTYRESREKWRAGPGRKTEFSRG